MPHTDMWHSHLKTRKTKTKVNPKLVIGGTVYENYQILQRRGYADWLVAGLGKPLNCPLYGLVAQLGERLFCTQEVAGS